MMTVRLRSPWLSCLPMPPIVMGLNPSSVNVKYLQYCSKGAGDIFGLHCVL
jgi:hypothetical protein